MIQKRFTAAIERDAPDSHGYHFRARRRCAAFISSKFRYFPVPMISRDVKTRFPILKFVFLGLYNRCHAKIITASFDFRLSCAFVLIRGSSFSKIKSDPRNTRKLTKSHRQRNERSRAGHHRVAQS